MSKGCLEQKGTSLLGIDGNIVTQGVLYFPKTVQASVTPVLLLSSLQHNANNFRNNNSLILSFKQGRSQILASSHGSALAGLSHAAGTLGTLGLLAS